MSPRNSGQFASKDIAGFRTGILTAIKPTGAKGSGGYLIWECICDCGTVVELPTNRIVNARQSRKSCGCIPSGRKSLPDGGSHVKAVLTKLRARSRQEGFDCTLTTEQVRALISQNCTYCGIEPPSKILNNVKGSFKRHGIDRIDSNKGYTLENSTACCFQCNVAKLDHSLEEFKSWVSRVYKHLVGQSDV